MEIHGSGNQQRRFLSVKDFAAADCSFWKKVCRGKYIMLEQMIATVFWI